MCTQTLQSPCRDCCSNISTWLIHSFSVGYHHSHITKIKYICQPYVKLQPTLSWTIPDLPKPGQLVFFFFKHWWFFLVNCVISSTWHSMFINLLDLPFPKSRGSCLFSHPNVLRGERDDRGWDGWMASLSQRTWIWASPRKQWRTVKPAVLLSFVKSCKELWGTSGL